MAKRRELKKNVNYIAGELFSECLINSKVLGYRYAKRKLTRLMVEIMKMQDEFISRISHTEPGNDERILQKIPFGLQCKGK